MIGTIMILNFSDDEKNIVDQLKTLIKDKKNIDYTQITSKSILSFPQLDIYLKEQEVYKCGKQIHLSNQEFIGLRFLAEHPGWICAKEEIYNAVCGEETTGDVNNIVYCLISSLRKKLETDPHHPEYIQTVRGAGYKFVVPRE